MKTSDVSVTFLQGAPINRNVFVTPPKERRIPGILWRLKKAACCLIDASTIRNMKCEQSLLDPAMYLYFDKNQLKEEEDRKIKGMMVTHVDDVLPSGNEEFENEVMKPLKSTYCSEQS